MSLRDPSAPTGPRVVTAVLVCLLALAAAGVAGWGWGGAAGDGPEGGAHVVALFVGQLASILLLVASGFVLPYRWRTGSVLGPLLVGLVGAGLLVAGVGYAVGGGGVRGGLAGVVAGVLVLAVGALVVLHSRRARERRADVRAHGAVTTGLVTEVSTAEMVNDVPRWRIVVRFSDAAGATRYWVDHRTTYSPPVRGQQALVHFDPAHPGDRRRIVADY